MRRQRARRSVRERVGRNSKILSGSRRHDDGGLSMTTSSGGRRRSGILNGRSRRARLLALCRLLVVAAGALPTRRVKVIRSNARNHGALMAPGRSWCDASSSDAVAPAHRRLLLKLHLFLSQAQLLLLQRLPLVVLGFLRRHLEVLNRAVEQVRVASEPGVTRDVFKGAPLRRIGHEHLEQEVPRLSRNPFRERERGVDDVLVQQVDVVAVGVRRIVVKGQVSGQHGVQDDAARPDVDGAADVPSILDDELRGGVARAAAARSHQIARLVFEPVRETKVGDDDVAVPVEQQVLELEVTVDDALDVEVHDARDELGKELGSVLFLEVPVRQDVIKQFSACATNQYLPAASSSFGAPLAYSNTMPMYFSVSITS